MSPRSASPGVTIETALEEFLEDRSPDLSTADRRLYRHVLFFLELCINNHGHRNLAEADRALFESLYHGAEGEGRDFFEVFGPELLLPELDFFVESYLRREVHTTERVVRRAREVVADLRSWLVRSGLVSPGLLERHEERARERSRLKPRLLRLVRFASRRIASVDPASLAAEDYVPADDHLLTRIESGRVWLRVYRTAAAEEIGPLLLPRELTDRLRIGWNLCCALGRLRGRWQILELDEIHPAARIEGDSDRDREEPTE